MGRTRLTPPLVTKGVGVYNLDQLYRKADEIDLWNGAAYYHEFRQRVKETSQRAHNGHFVPIQISAGVYAALSPNNSQDSCMEDMQRAIRCHLYEPHNFIHLKVHTYGANKEKALRILKGEDPKVVLTGPKTFNFYHNIENPDDPNYVTVDGHMVNIWNNKRVPLDNSGVNLGEYLTVASGIKELAQRYGLVPCQLQAILWLTWRRIHRIYYNPQYKLDLGE